MRRPWLTIALPLAIACGASSSERREPSPVPVPITEAEGNEDWGGRPGPHISDPEMDDGWQQ
ncbi:MAG: hypothetical protein KF901_06385 [Myxococcales bacterium]|nr:hypothetical protein [Myxococcales bacterium]